MTQQFYNQLKLNRKFKFKDNVLGRYYSYMPKELKDSLEKKFNRYVKL